jgi:hypothetical protein
MYPAECCKATPYEDLKGYVVSFDNSAIGTCELSGTNTDLFTPATLPMQNWDANPPVVPPSLVGGGMIVVQ